MAWLGLAIGCGCGAEASGGSHFVRVPAEAGPALEAAQVAPLFSSDYGSFRWLELSTADWQRLRDAGIEFDDQPQATEIQVGRYRFDPVGDRAPDVAAGALTADGLGFHLVQFRGPIREEWRRDLETAGLLPLQYFPANAYLVWGARRAVEALAGAPAVRWQGSLSPAFKRSPTLDGRSGTIRNVDLLLFGDGSAEPLASALEGLGGHLVSLSPAQPDRRLWSAIAELPAEAVEEVSRRPEMLWIGHQSSRPLLDDEMSDQIVAGNHPGGTPVTGYLAHLASLGFDGGGVTWAIVDSGIDYDHPDLGPSIVGGYSFPGACNPPGQPGSDCTASGSGHGTHVAGIVGGTGALGLTDFDGFLYGLGVAPGVSLYAMNSISGTAWPPAGGWQEHSKRALLGGAVGGNNSWTSGEGANHGYQSSERTHDFMVRDGNFDTPAVAEPYIAVFSAGNSGPSGNSLTAPKEAKNPIVVAATNNYRLAGIDSIAFQSSRGPAVDGRQIPTVAAPGWEISSALNDAGGGSCTQRPIAGTGGFYSFCSGTSMAAPHVSGSLAVVTEWWRSIAQGANPSPAMAKALLVNQAVPVGTGPRWNNEGGWGRVHLTRIVAPGVAAFYRDQTAILATAGESLSWQFSVADPDQPLLITLAWSDAPGAAGANPALVNDLNLTVVKGGTTWRGNVLSAGWSTSGGSPDTLNNLENVFVQSPGPGSFQVTVSAANLPGDGVPLNGDPTDQDFALVCTNCVAAPDFTFAVSPPARAVCAPANAQYTVNVGQQVGFTNPVTLSVGGLPAGASSNFSVNPVVPSTPDAASTLTIGNTGAAPAGSYTLTVSGASTTGTKNRTVHLDLFSTSPAAPALSAPADGAASLALRPTLSWAPASQARSYRLQVATDAAFSDLVLDASGLTGLSFSFTADLDSDTVHYWRVQAENACGAGPFSAAFSFRTLAIVGDCPPGESTQTALEERFESGALGWTTSGTGVTWAASSARARRGASSWLGQDVATLSDQRLVSPAVVLPEGQSTPTLQFWHDQTIERRPAGGCFDAALVEISLDGGATWVPFGAPSILADPYDGLVDGTSGNPLAGASAWCGDPQPWTRAVVDLVPYAGLAVRFRFRLATDNGTGRLPHGWYLDEVRVRSCNPPAHLFSHGFESGSLVPWSGALSD